MSKRKSPPPVKGNSDNPDNSDWGDESFDIPEPPPAQNRGNVQVVHVLTADQVAAVRFHATRPGYSYDEVEAFVEQVKGTLGALEQALYEKDVALHEAREFEDELQDRISTLTATIEVFRAKGDPVVRSDGSYVTESQVSAQRADAEMTIRIQELEAELRRVHAAIAGANSGKDAAEARAKELETEAQELRAELEAAEQSEEELRDYIDNTLAPWLAAHSSNETPAPTNAGDSTGERVGALTAPEVETTTRPRPFGVATTGANTAESAAGVSDNATETSSEETDDDADDPDILLDGDDWGDDAPTIGAVTHPSASQPRQAQVDEDEDEEADEDSQTKPPPPSPLLSNAPELMGG